ncbi:hypothetical protein BOX15_Mlig034300g1 [Macrostomum lignano]|uniref:Uncharacterized protein n=2 Tax=Macrostomum lignano TaxID=282301 RepID=A0A267EJT2_9PLAT|nr:hypothetical protein BOX15_Mlig034300g2 [Macrostomum lignano]PAA61783.1 hypothetical protein BOX15_Mlig034300g1 [Macrostomum lignano]
MPRKRPLHCTARRSKGLKFGRQRHQLEIQQHMACPAASLINTNAASVVSAESSDAPERFVHTEFESLGGLLLQQNFGQNDEYDDEEDYYSGSCTSETVEEMCIPTVGAPVKDVNQPAAAESAPAPVKDVNQPAAAGSAPAPVKDVNQPAAAGSAPAPVKDVNQPAAAESAPAPVKDVNQPAAAGFAPASVMKDVKQPAAELAAPVKYFQSFTGDKADRAKQFQDVSKYLDHSSKMAYGSARSVMPQTGHTEKTDNKQLATLVKTENRQLSMGLPGKVEGQLTQAIQKSTIKISSKQLPRPKFDQKVPVKIAKKLSSLKLAPLQETAKPQSEQKSLKSVRKLYSTKSASGEGEPQHGKSAARVRIQETADSTVESGENSLLEFWNPPDGSTTVGNDDLTTASDGRSSGVSALLKSRYLALGMTKYQRLRKLRRSRNFGNEPKETQSHQVFLALTSPEVTEMFAYHAPTIGKIARFTGCRIRLMRAVLNRKTNGSGTWARFAQVEIEGARRASATVCDRILREKFPCYADRRIKRLDDRQSISTTLSSSLAGTAEPLAFSRQRSVSGRPRTGSLQRAMSHQLGSTAVCATVQVAVAEADQINGQT